MNDTQLKEQDFEKWFDEFCNKFYVGTGNHVGFNKIGRQMITPRFSTGSKEDLREVLLSFFHTQQAKQLRELKEKLGKSTARDVVPDIDKYPEDQKFALVNGMHAGMSYVRSLIEQMGKEDQLQTTEKGKLPCGCPKTDRFAMCINQEHVGKEKANE